MKDRLQFKRDEHLYIDRADIISHIEDYVKDKEGYYSLFAEPIIFKYGTDDKNPDGIVLAIGAYGDGTPNSHNKYFLIDTASIEADINVIFEKISGNTEDIVMLQSYIENIINSIELRTNGSFDLHQVIDSRELHDLEYFNKAAEGGWDTTIMRVLVALNDGLVAETKARQSLASELEKETSNRILGDDASKQYAHDIYKESSDNAIKITNVNENDREIALKIRNGEKILSQDTYGISSTLSFKFNETSNMIQLIGIDGQLVTEMDASRFIKDGLLDKVSIIKNLEEQKELDKEGQDIGWHTFPYMLLIWNTESHKSSMRIAIDELDIYKPGDGLALTNRTFSIKIDENKNEFLSVDENGIKVEGVTTAIDNAKKAATTKIEKEIDASHITITAHDNADGSKTYEIGDIDIASEERLNLVSDNLKETNTHIANIVTNTIGSGFSEYTLTHAIEMETEFRKNADENIKNTLGNGIEGTTITSAVTENIKSIERIKDIIGDGMPISLTSAVQKLQQSASTTEEKFVVVENNINAIKSTVGEGFGEEGSLTNIITTTRESAAKNTEDIISLKHIVAKKVDTIEGKGLSTNDFSDEYKEKLELCEENTIDIIKINGEEQIPDRNKTVNINMPFVKLSSDEKIISLEEGTLLSHFNVVYSPSANRITFYGKNNSELAYIDTHDFVIEGFIDDIEIVINPEGKPAGTYLKFTFKKTDGTLKVVFLPAEKLIKVYEVESGSTEYMHIENFTIGLNVDNEDGTGLASRRLVKTLSADTKSEIDRIDEKVGNGFIDESGETVSITEVVTLLNDKIDSVEYVFKEDFKVAGIIGTLGTGEIHNGSIIQKGTPVLEVLKKILQKELWPTAVNPSAEIVLENKGIYEVGTVIAPKYHVTFNSGKFTYDDGTMEATGIQATGYIVTNGKDSKTESSGTMPEIIVSDKTNYTLSASVLHGFSITPKTNLGNEVPDAQIKSGVTTCSDGIIVGYRPIFYDSIADGIIPDYDNITSEQVLENLTKYEHEDYPSFISVIEGSQAILILVPYERLESGRIRKIINTNTGYDETDLFVRHTCKIKTYAEEETEETMYYAFVYDPGTDLSENTYKIIF